MSAMAAGLAAMWWALFVQGPGAAAARAFTATGTKTIAVAGQTAFRVPGLVSGGTTYLPIWYVQQVLRRIGFENTWDGKEWDIASRGAPHAVNYRPPAGTMDREIVFHGRSLYRVPSIVDYGTTFMPIWYIQQLLKQVGDTSTWSNPVWNIVLGPGQHDQTPTPYGVASTKTVSLNGRTVFHATGIVHRGTTYLPLSTLAPALDDLGLANVTTKSSEWDISTQGTAQATDGTFVPPGQYAIVLDGQAPVYVPHFVYQKHTYLPLYYVGKLLRQAGLTTVWNGWNWNVSQLGSPTAQTAAPLVFGFVTNYGGTSVSLNDTEAHQGQVNQIGTFDHVVQPDGQILGTAPAAILSYAASQQLPAYATITNLSGQGFSGSAMDTVLQSSTSRAVMQQNVLQLMQADSYSGVVLDIEQLPAADRAKYTAFLTTLAVSLHSAGKKLDVVVPPDTSASSEPWNGAYDYAKIGAAVDKVILMTYDFSYPGGPAGPIAPVPWVKRVLGYATQTISPGKLLLGVDAYGYDWSGHSTQALSLTKVDALIQSDHIVPSWDAKDEAPYFTYTDAKGVKHTVYYENARSTAAKLALATQAGVAGIAVWHMGLEDQAVWGAVVKYISP